MPRSESLLSASSRHTLLMIIQGCIASLPPASLPNYGALIHMRALLKQDDWGQYNAGYRGDTDARTPSIDELAAEGLVLERFYVHKWCAPTRSSLMTGRNPMHTGLDPMNWTLTSMRGEGCDPPRELAGCDSSLSPDYVFLPRLLRSAGYESGMLGKVRPSPLLWARAESYAVLV